MTIQDVNSAQTQRSSRKDQSSRTLLPHLYHAVSAEMPIKPDNPQAVSPNDRERGVGVYSARNLQKVLGALHQDGLVILRDVIDKAHIDSLNLSMSEEAQRRLNDPEQRFNHNLKCRSRRCDLERPQADSGIHETNADSHSKPISSKDPR